MNVVKVMGGLGNQMFQYAFARKMDAKLDLSFYESPDNFTETIPTRTFLLDKFHCKYEVSCKSYFAFYINDETYEENRVYKHTLFDGYWQKPSYYRGIYYDLLDELTLKDEYITDDMRRVVTEMNGCDSVAIHVRRTDYVSLGHALDADFYHDAISQIRQEIKKPVFYVFSDDIEWCNENLKIPCEFIHMKDYEDLYLLSHSKNIIMANSTFSFWGQFLNRHVQRVIAPKDWHGVPSMFDERGNYL